MIKNKLSTAIKDNMSTTSPPKQPFIKKCVKDLFPTFLRQLIQPKRLNVLCVGTPKSGTTSIANLFSKGYRYEHEGERYEHVKCIFSHFSGDISDDKYQQHLEQRAKRLWLDIESNCFLGYRIDLVYKAAPDAKYILTIREPYSWLKSIFDNNINFPINKGFTEKWWHNFFFKPDQYTYSGKESVLKEFKLYPIDAYLNYWVDANKSVIDTIPDSQLLILYTDQISDDLNKISSFLQIKENSINKKRTRMNVTDKKHHVMKKLDQQYVRERIDAICNKFITSYSLDHLSNEKAGTAIEKPRARLSLKH